MKATSFPPINARRPRALILGSMPGVASLKAQQYYHHPQNAFWPIMGELFGMTVETYPQRLKLITSHELALWDVLKYCERPGSLDSSIRRDSIIVNDFAAFLAEYTRISHIFFNGGTAERMFMRHVAPVLPKQFEYYLLPSTSPAMATMKRAAKVKAWSVVRKVLTQ